MSKYPNRGKKQFSDAENRAYYSGQGYKLAKKGKRINFKNKNNEQSFVAGYMSVDANRYPDVKSK